MFLRERGGGSGLFAAQFIKISWRTVVTPIINMLGATALHETSSPDSRAEASEMRLRLFTLLSNRGYLSGVGNWLHLRHEGCCIILTLRSCSEPEVVLEPTKSRKMTSHNSRLLRQASEDCVSTLDFDFIIAASESDEALPGFQPSQAPEGSDGESRRSLIDGVISTLIDWRVVIDAERRWIFALDPPSDALYTEGFAYCQNGTFVLDGSATWWYCEEGDDTSFYFRDAVDGLACQQKYLEIGATYSDNNKYSTRSTSDAAGSPSDFVTVTQTVGLNLATSTSHTTRLTALPTLHEELDSEKTLSTGAKAGIGVGTAVAVIALLCVGAFCLWRVRRRRPHSRAVTPPYARAGESFENANASVQVHEKDGQETNAELYGDGQAWEADGREKEKKQQHQQEHLLVER